MQIIGLQNRFIGELHNPSSNFYLQYFIRLAYKKIRHVAVYHIAKSKVLYSKLENICKYKFICKLGCCLSGASFDSWEKIRKKSCDTDTLTKRGVRDKNKFWEEL